MSALRVRRSASGLMATVGVCAALSCASHSDALARGQRYYEDNQYERALALWRDLDRRGAVFSSSERARYAYFRGMTDYRLGYRDDARHWLAIARAREAAQSGSLGSASLERLDSALADLGRNPAHSGRGAADVVQTIEAAPGPGLPGEPISNDSTSNDDASKRPAPARPSDEWPLPLEGPAAHDQPTDAGVRPAP